MTDSRIVNPDQTLPIIHISMANFRHVIFPDVQLCWDIYN